MLVEINIFYEQFGRNYYEKIIGSSFDYSNSSGDLGRMLNRFNRFGKFGSTCPFSGGDFIRGGFFGSRQHRSAGRFH